MNRPLFASFCYCFGLDTGAKTIGIVHTITASLLVGYSTYLAIQFKAYVRNGEDVNNLYSNAAIYMCLTSSAGLVHVFLGIILLIGAIRKNKSLLKIWVVMMSLLVTAAIFFLIIVSLIYGIKGKSDDIALNVLEATCVFAYITYAILSVKSYYQSLKYSEASNTS